MAAKPLSIIFAHGLQSSPLGHKATYLREQLGALTPDLSRLGLGRQTKALLDLVPQKEQCVAVGSSLGALAVLGLAAQRPAAIAHLILLAPAMGVADQIALHPEVEQARPGLTEEIRHFGTLTVPPSIPATAIHGLADDVVPLDKVLTLIQNSPSARLILVHDNHSLTTSQDLILSTVNAASRGLDPLTHKK